MDRKASLTASNDEVSQDEFHQDCETEESLNSRTSEQSAQFDDIIEPEEKPNRSSVSISQCDQSNDSMGESLNSNTSIKSFQFEDIIEPEEKPNRSSVSISQCDQFNDSMGESLKNSITSKKSVQFEDIVEPRIRNSSVSKSLDHFHGSLASLHNRNIMRSVHFLDVIEPEKPSTSQRNFFNGWREKRTLSSPRKKEKIVRWSNRSVDSDEHAHYSWENGTIFEVITQGELGLKMSTADNRDIIICEVLDKNAYPSLRIGDILIRINQDDIHEISHQKFVETMNGELMESQKLYFFRKLNRYIIGEMSFYQYNKFNSLTVFEDMFYEFLKLAGQTPFGIVTVMTGALKSDRSYQWCDRIFLNSPQSEKQSNAMSQLKEFGNDCVLVPGVGLLGILFNELPWGLFPPKKGDAFPILWRDIASIVQNPDLPYSKSIHEILDAGIGIVAAIPCSVDETEGIIVFGARKTVDQEKFTSYSNQTSMMESAGIISSLLTLQIDYNRVKEERMGHSVDYTNKDIENQMLSAEPEIISFFEWIKNYSNKCLGTNRMSPPPLSWYHTNWVFFGTFITFFLWNCVNLKICEETDSQYYLTRGSMGSFVASQFLMFNAPAAQPYNGFFSQVVNGFFMVLVTYIPGIPYYIKWSLFPSIIIGFMGTANLIHPPAGGDVLLYSIYGATWRQYGAVLFNYVFAINMATIINNISIDRQYPIFWRPKSLYGSGIVGKVLKMSSMTGKLIMNQSYTTGKLIKDKTHKTGNFIKDHRHFMNIARPKQKKNHEGSIHFNMSSIPE